MPLTKKSLIRLFILFFAVALLFLTGYVLGTHNGREHAKGISASDIMQDGVFIGFADDIMSMRGGDATQIIIAYNGGHIIDQISVIASHGSLSVNENEEESKRVTIDASQRYADRITYYLPAATQGEHSVISDKLEFEFYVKGHVIFTEVIHPMSFDYGSFDSAAADTSQSLQPRSNHAPVNHIFS